MEAQNVNETWDTDVPDFSTCFQDTVLVLAPCAVFSVLGLLNLLLLSRYIPSTPLPWTWRLSLKVFLGIVLFVTSLSWCSIYAYQKFSEESVFLPLSTVTASFARSVTYAVVIALILKHKVHGITTSVILCTFWICFAACSFILHRSLVLKHSSLESSPSWSYYLGMVHYPIIYAELILSFFSDKSGFTSLEAGSPIDEAPFLSNILFLWFNKIIFLSWKKPLAVSDFFPLPKKIRAAYLSNVFSKNWKFNRFDSHFQNPSLALALFKSYWRWLLSALFLDMLYVLTLLMPPLILDRILDFVKHDDYQWRMYYYCAVIFIVFLISKTIQNNYLMYLAMTVSQVKSSLISAVYRKNLVLACSERKNFTSGSITSMVSVDVNRIANFALYCNTMITAPFRIILVIVVMWQYLGISTLAGLAVIILMFPFSFVVSRISEKLTDKQMKVKDSRLKIINEILSGIKILKFYAWEVPFSQKLMKTRKREIKLIRLSQLCYVASSFVFQCAPLMVALASFSSYLLSNPNHILDPTTAFVSLNLLEQLRFALFMVPDSISELIQTITAIKRIRIFLSAEEIDPDVVGFHPQEGDAVTIKDATFYFSKESDFVLENINLKIPSKKVVAVIGPVGAGKSALLSALLGEMYKSKGSIDISGNIAYVPQEAWILNRTLKQNVILEKTLSINVYNKVVKCCSLLPDFEMLPGRDETEIGEKGINLSGGQKQRVSVARAVYQDRDIYLLDDPLSAVDAHVRRALFDKVVGRDGLLRNKTRILVTHDISVLPDVDFIVRMDEGRIVEVGTYKELLNKSGSFKDFIKTHAKVDDNISVDSNDSASSGNTLLKRLISRTISDDKHRMSDVKECIDNQDGNLTEEEKMEEGSVKKGIFLNYAKHIGWFLFIVSMVGYITVTVFEAGGNIWVAKWSSDVPVNGTRDASQTTYRLAVYGALGFGQAASFVVSLSSLVFGSTKAAQLYHNQMLESVLKSPMSFFDVTPMGRIVNRFSSDMDTLDIHIIYDFEAWIICVLLLLSTIVVIGMNIPIFLAYILPLAVLYIIFLKLHLLVSRQLRRLESVTRSPIYGHVLESIYGVSSIKAFQVQREFIERLETALDKNIACLVGTASCNRWLHFWLDVISCTIILIATLLALIDRKQVGASAIGLIITYALAVTDAMMWFIRSNNELQNKSVAIERVDEYCHLPSEAPRQIPENDPDPSWPQKGEILFDNYSTRYRENLDLVLKNLSVNMLSHEKVGIVGRTGAGKSSITLALFRIIEPASGTILIDNVDLSKIGLYALRSKLTIIPQDPVLFTGTLRFNLDPNDEYTDSEIWESLSNAHLRDYVSGLVEGLQHPVEEGGANLSAGQKQLLCLSRALLKKSKILILDEATAAVDMDTDKLVQDTIRTAFAKNTVITIAHRLNTVMDYDKIVVMDAGEVAEVGSPSSLLQDKESRFFKLAQEAGLT